MLVGLSGLLPELMERKRDSDKKQVKAQKPPLTT
jgi:hypothetical protein